MMKDDLSVGTDTRNKYNIVIVADHAHVSGGQAKVAIESALGLSRRGHSVTFFAAVGPVDTQLLSSGVNVVCLSQDDMKSARSKIRFVFQVLWNTVAARRLRETLSGLRSDNTVVHIHGWAKALSPSIASVIRGFPVIYTMHEYFLVCPNGGFYNHRLRKPCLRKPLSLSCIFCNCDSRSYAHKVLRVLRHLLLASYGGMQRAISALVTISALQYQVSVLYIQSAIRHYRIDNPIAVKKSRLMPLKKRNGFIYVGRLSHEKGVEVLLAAARMSGIIVSIVGDGPTGDHLRQQYPEMTYIGWRTPQDTIALMQQARCMVLPSVWYEGQPLTVYESLAVGTPVIVSDVCAGREAVIDGINGYRFVSNNKNSLAEKMLLLNDDAHAERLSKQAYAGYWVKPLTLDRHLNALERVYNDVLSK